MKKRKKYEQYPVLVWLDIKQVYLTILLVLVLLIGFGSTIAEAQETCVPVGTGGAYNHLSGGAPKFWDTTTDALTFTSCNEDNFNRFNKWIDDPRWDGATSTTHGNGTTEIMQFRAVQRVVSGQNYMFLSWWMKNTASMDNPSANQLYVGFRPDDTTSPGIVLKVVPSQATDAIGASAVQGAAVTTLYVLTSNTLPSTANMIYNGTTGTQALPLWAQDARVWINKSRITPGTNCAPGPAVVWAVHLRVPLQTNISPDLSNLVSLGSTAQRKFRLWYTAHLYTQTDGIVPLTWPRTTGTTPSVDNFDMQQPPPDFLDAPPLFSAWPAFYLSTGSADTTASCTADGVTIVPSDISVNYPGSIDDWKIGIPATSSAPSPVNTFHAKPTSKSGQPINRGDLHARFSMANWGAQVQDGEADPGTGEWTEIAGLGDVIDPAVGQVANGGKWDINSIKQFTFNEFVGKSSHQCIQVELFGGSGGLNFLKSSAFRNMHTARLSTFREEAEVSLAGLPGGSTRDVYLYVEPHNMPAVDLREPLPESISVAVPIKETRDKTPTEVAEVSIRTPEYERRAAAEPAYIVRAFYDTGRKTRDSRVALQPMVSFGYFPEHTGDSEGFRHKLEGAESIPGTDNWYRLRVNGKAKITNILEAIEPKRFSIGLNVGVAIPHGSFNNSNDAGLALSASFEYRLTHSYSVEARYGRHKFKGVSSAPDVDVTQYSVNAKRYFLGGPLRYFLNAGSGSYTFSPGTTNSGVNAGAGLQYLLSTEWALEGAYNYHRVANGALDNPTFSTVQVGVRYRF